MPNSRYDRMSSSVLSTSTLSVVLQLLVILLPFDGAYGLDDPSIDICALFERCQMLDQSIDGAVIHPPHKGGAQLRNGLSGGHTRVRGVSGRFSQWPP